MLARICVANDIYDRGMGILETVGHDGWNWDGPEHRMPELRVGQSALNFKRVQRSQGGATAELGNSDNLACRGRVAQGVARGNPCSRKMVRALW